jgi:hypothetical protein
MEEEDDKTTFSVCGDEALCRQLCYDSEGCYGFHMSKDSPRCFLSKSPCAEEILHGELVPSSKYDYFAKIDPETTGGGAACPMGVAVLARGLENNAETCMEVNDQYNPLPGGGYSSGCATLEWSKDGCGWLVTVPKPDYYYYDAPACTDPACLNKVDEANYLFGFPGTKEEFDPEICSRTEPWLQMGYCTNALYEALCPEECSLTCDTCEAWVNDNEPAAVIVASMLELPVTTTACAALKAEELCEDIVVYAVCLSTCAPEERRLSKATPEHVSKARAKYSAQFQLALRTIADSRRLQDGFPGNAPGRVAIYGSWDPANRPARCDDTISSSTKPVDETLISGTKTWYDFFEWRYEGQHFTVQVMCEGQTTFPTKSKTYCPTNNLDINTEDMAETAPQIVDDLCWKKCNSDTPGSHCEGHSPSFNAFSNALCVTRNECEDYCASLGDACAGIEMHRYLPRCYLIGKTCGESRLVESEDFDQAEKLIDRFRYRTYADKKCTLTAPYMTMNGLREECEEKCNEDKSCAGFNFNCASEVCEFFQVPITGTDASTFDNTKYCTAGKYKYGKLDTVPNLVDEGDDEDFQYVEKSSEEGVSLVEPWEKPCTPTLNGAELADQFGEFTRFEPDHEFCAGQVDVCFVSKDAVWRYVWAHQDAFDESYNPTTHTGLGLNRKCKGWVLQKFEDDSWASKYMSWSEGLEECESDDGSGPVLTAESELYLWAPRPRPPAKLEHICKSYPTCSLLQTCVLGRSRFANELSIQLTRPGVDASTATWLSDLDDVALGTVLDTMTYQPKTLVSVEKVVSFISSAKMDRARGYINRNVPGHFSVRVNNLGKATKAVVTLTSADPVESDRELGFQMGTPPQGYEPWLTDIVKVERFTNPNVCKPNPQAAPNADPDAFIACAGLTENACRTDPHCAFVTAAKQEPYSAQAPAPSAGTLDFHAPTVPRGGLHVYFVPKSGVMADGFWVPVDGIPDEPEYFRVTMTWDGYHVGTTEQKCPNPVPQTVQDPSMEVSNCADVDAGASCALRCKPGYAKSGDFKCSLGQWSAQTCAAPADYEAETMLFSLSQRSRVDYGWKIRAVNFYSSPECKGKVAGVTAVSQSAPPYAGSSFTAAMINGNMLSEASCVTGNYAPGACGGEYWAMGLNKNPYSVDMTHEEGTTLDFAVPKMATVGCVQVVSRTMTNDGAARQYYPTDLGLVRGWSTNARKTAPLEDSIVSLDGWTELWTVGMNETTEYGFTHTFLTVCGEPGRVYGELLEEVAAVPSACHCKQLCVDNAPGGCVQWNYHPASQDCVLLKSVKAAPSEVCEADADWVSGDTGVRITGIEPSAVLPGEPFDLKVLGYGLPTEGSKYSQTTGSRQRVKIVPAMTDGKPTVCAEAPVAEAVEGIGCTHPYFCAPRPSAFDANSATWAGLTIHASTATAEYKVCYNSGFTYDRYMWHDVGSLTVVESAFTWATQPAELLRTTPYFRLTVTKISALTPEDPDHFRLKLVPVHFSCDVASETKFSLGNGGNASHATPDAGIWESIPLYSQAADTYVEAGDYKVCFSADQTGPFREIPSGDGQRYLTVSANDYSTHERDVFWAQKLSAKAGKAATLTLSGNRLQFPTTSKLAFWEGGCATAPAGGAPKVVADLDEAKSSAEGYVFPVAEIPAGFEAGTYDLCYCDALSDETLDTTAGGSTYTVEGDKVCGGATTAGAELHSNVLKVSQLNSAAKEELCTVKCSRGCVGKACYCDSYDPSTMFFGEDVATLETTRVVGGTAYTGEEGFPLCTDAAGCRDACNAHTACQAFDFDPARNLCWLLKNAKECVEFGLTNAGEDCHDACGGVAGPCPDFCGSGLCCLKDSTDGGCPGGDIGGDIHLCVAASDLNCPEGLLTSPESARSYSTLAKTEGVVLTSTLGADYAWYPTSWDTSPHMTIDLGAAMEVTGVTTMGSGATTVTASVNLAVSAEGFAAMQANPAAARAALASGIGAAIGVPVTIISTDPDLGGARRLAERRLAGIELKVVFAAMSATLSAADIAGKVQAVSATALTAAVNTAMVEQGLPAAVTGAVVAVSGFDCECTEVSDDDDAYAYAYDDGDDDARQLAELASKYRELGTRTVCVCEAHPDPNAGDDDYAYAYDDDDARRLQTAAGDRVTAYTVEYSVDGVLWLDADGGKELPGNDDNDNQKTNKFDTPFVARYVRFLPTSWSGVGIAMQADVFAKPCAKGNKKEGRELWTRKSGAACTHLPTVGNDVNDFGTTVGTVTLTKRVDVDQVWVLAPGEAASIEVLGDGLGWKEDRVMIIDSTGVCGVSEPTVSSSGPFTTTKQYSHWVAEPPVFTDPPGDDFAPAAAAGDDVAVLWRKKSGKYCPGNNMPLSELPADASKHTCYNKCVRNAPCSGLDCHCSGLMQGYDGPDSTAMCLPENKCKEVCKETEGCYGIDMAERVIEVRDVTKNTAPKTVGQFFKFFKKDTLPFGGQGPYDAGSTLYKFLGTGRCIDDRKAGNRKYFPTMSKLGAAKAELIQLCDQYPNCVAIRLGGDNEYGHLHFSSAAALDSVIAPDDWSKWSTGDTGFDEYGCHTDCQPLATDDEGSEGDCHVKPRANSDYIVQHWRDGVKLRTATVTLTDGAVDDTDHDAYGKLKDGSGEGQFETGDVLLFVDHLESGATWCDVPDDDARLNEEGGPGTCASWADEDWCDHPEDGSGMRMWFRGVCAATCCERGGHGGESGGYDDGAYSKSFTNTLDCPKGDEPIPTAAICEAAAESLGGTYKGDIDNPDKPGGCHYTDGTNMKFNANAGVKEAGRSVVCIRGGASRCFLNGQRKNPSDEGSCEEYIVDDKLTALATMDYSFNYMQRVEDGRRLATAFLEKEDDPNARKDSWAEILRFKGAGFPTGGQFKACFCDRNTLEEPKLCKETADYKIEIGTVHVSGVECLIADSKFQRGTCVAQSHGGLRCYTGAAPKLTSPPELAAAEVEVEKVAAEAVTTLSSYCLYGPEEETRDDPLC